jgi:hypothetical protein
MASLQKIDLTSLYDIAKDVLQKGADAGKAAAKKAQAETEAKLLAQLRAHFADEKVYAYDDSSSNRFLTQPPRKGESVAVTFTKCLALTKAHLIRYLGQTGWEAVVSELERFDGEVPEPNKPLIFHARNRWYCFYCLDGHAFCDLVASQLENERAERNKQARPLCSDSYDDL